jgi:anti-sigma regulatory factor (Ser/Thr protein kinase)
MTAPPFRHEALLYAGPDQFLDGTLRFIRAGVAAGEPTLVVLVADKIAALRRELGSEGAAVLFADMADVGANPARIIPAWREFVAEHGAGDRPLRGIGEPIYPARGPAELVECERHEALLNLAFDETPNFWLLCPYDTHALPPAVIEEAQRNHPRVCASHGDVHESALYRGLEEVAAPFDDPLPPPPRTAFELNFGAAMLSDVRRAIREHAARAGLRPARIRDLIVAASEIAANSVRHGGGWGTLCVWDDGATLFCEMRDRGRLDDPLVGRNRPRGYQEGGYGLWLANHLCDLVQVRCFTTGSVVRLHMALSRTAAACGVAPARPSRAGSTT